MYDMVPVAVLLLFGSFLRVVLRQGHVLDVGNGGKDEGVGDDN